MIQLSDLPEFKRIGKKMRKLAKKNGWKVRDLKLAKFKTSDLRGFPETEPLAKGASKETTDA